MNMTSLKKSCQNMYASDLKISDIMPSYAIVLANVPASAGKIMSI